MPTIADAKFVVQAGERSLSRPHRVRAEVCLKTTILITSTGVSRRPLCVTSCEADDLRRTCQSRRSREGTLGSLAIEFHKARSVQ